MGKYYMQICHKLACEHFCNQVGSHALFESFSQYQKLLKGAVAVWYK